MEIHFTVTPQLLYGAQRAIAHQIPWLRWGGIWMSVLFPIVMIGITLAFGGTVADALRSNWGLIIGLPVFWLVGIPLLQRWSVARALRNTPSLQGEQIYVFDPAGLHVTTPVSAATIQWAAIVRAVETSDFFLLFQNKAMALFIPKSAFASVSEQERFRQIVRGSLGERAAWGASTAPLAPAI